MSWDDFVEDWWHNLEGAFFHLPLLESLQDEHREVVLLTIAAVHATFQNHVLPRANNGDGFTSRKMSLLSALMILMKSCRF